MTKNKQERCSPKNNDQQELVLEVTYKSISLVLQGMFVVFLFLAFSFRNYYLFSNHFVSRQKSSSKRAMIAKHISCERSERNTTRSVFAHRQNSFLILSSYCFAVIVSTARSVKLGT